MINKNNKKVFFITGTGRSGSTLLDLMLGNDPNGFSVGEVIYLMRPWRPHHILHEKTCHCGEPGCAFWSSIKKGGEINVYNHIFEQKPDKNFIVDSSKNILWLKDQLQYSKGEDYDVIPILIYKKPLEYAYSRNKRNNLNNWKKGWRKIHQRLFAVLDNFHSVQYKQLAKDPVGKLKSLCNALDIKYFNGKEQFWNNQHDHFLFGSDTVRHSSRIVYYEDQYDARVLNDLEKRLELNDPVLNDIESVLNRFEVDSNERIDKDTLVLKHKLGDYKLPYQLFHRLKAGPSYKRNRLVANLFKL